MPSLTAAMKSSPSSGIHNRRRGNLPGRAAGSPSICGDGREKLPPAPAAQTQIIEVGDPIPLIIRNCAPNIRAVEIGGEIREGKCIPSEFGQHEDALVVSNTFPQGVSGKAVVHFPPGWEIEPPQISLQAAAGETIRLPLLLTFPPDASLGELRPSIDFDIAADRPYKFSMFLPYHLGLGDVDLTVVSRWTPDGVPRSRAAHHQQYRPSSKSSSSIAACSSPARSASGTS